MSVRQVASADAVASTVVTAFSILESMGLHGKVTPQDLVHELHLNRATVHRTLFTLQLMGFVGKHPDGSYRLTFHVFELGNMVLHSYNLINPARRTMLELAQETGLTVNHAIMWQGEILYVDRADSTAHLRVDRPVGQSDPIHCTALGKVLLAFLDIESREATLARIKLRALTSNTITDMHAFRAELERVRSQGYAIDDQELSMELRCVATLIRRPDGALVSAISLSAPADRMSIDTLEGMVPRLFATADRIGKELESTTPLRKAGL